MRLWNRKSGGRSSNLAHEFFHLRGAKRLREAGHTRRRAHLSELARAAASTGRVGVVSTPLAGHAGVAGMAAVVVRSDHGTLEETRARAILPTVSGNSPHQMFGGENKQFGGEKKETPVILLEIREKKSQKSAAIMIQVHTWYPYG